MAGKIILYICFILYLLVSVKDAESSKLNVPRVLLPIFTKFSINFTLEVTEGGCYKWTTSRLDIVQLTPLYENNEQECSARAIVSSISKEATRNTAIVLAEEQYTGQVLRCDVIVDIISSLGIVTTTRELYMEEAPEAFEVRAYDDQGNEFTTLENVQFDWAIKCTGSSNLKDDLNVLRFMTFRDSPYETPRSVQAFEELGLRGHIALLEGIKTGSAKLSVRLPYQEYAGVHTAEVALMVVANLIIEPADVYILRGDVIQYRIIQVKHGRLEQIELSSSQYYLKVVNEKTGVIDTDTGFFTGLEEGKTRVILHDRNVDSKNDADLKLPSTSISVTYPNRMTLSILPNHNWAVLLGQKHEIFVEVFAKNDHKIFLGRGVQLHTKVNEALFQVSSCAKNGSWFAGTAIVEGIAQVSSKLVSLTSTHLGTVILEPTLSVTNDILIYPQITLHPNEVVFPWDPQTQPKYEIQMRASGGDGKFIWSSTNHTVGTVTQTGLAHTYWHGQYDVCASMCRNTNNKKCSKFYIVPPVKLEIVEYVMENEIGVPIFLHIALFAQRTGSSTLIPFTQCDKLNFRVKPLEHNFIYNKTATIEPVGISCKSLAVVGLSTATSRITVSYNREGYKIEDNVIVSAYNRLKVLYPQIGYSVIALGTSRNIIFTGGPRPWIGRSTEHSYKIDSTNSQIVKVLDTTDNYRSTGDSDMYVVHVLCKEIGESHITLTVINKPLFQNCKHQASTATATIYCSVPHLITLQPEIKMPGDESCPMDLSAERVVVQSYRDIHLDISIKDDAGRKFDNITSFKFEWHMSPVVLGSCIIHANVMPKNITYQNVLLPDGFYQGILPQSQAGTLEVTAKIVGYLPDVLKQNNVRLKDIRKPVHTKISLYLVDDTVISPNHTSIYNHVENKYYISVKQGSGFYELTLSADNIADIRYIESKRLIEVTPQTNGELRVSLNDLCLKSEPAFIMIRIVSVAAINVEVPDRVQLGRTMKAVVKFYDESDNSMPLPKLEYLDIRYIMEDDIITIKLLEEDPKNPWPVGEVHYLVRGLQLGDTQLVFAAGRGVKEVVSQPMSIQVFAPIKLVPRNTTLFVGAELQLTVQGGPQPDANIEYLVQHENIIEVNQNGLVKGLAIGLARVIGRSIGICPCTGNKMVHGQDVIDVNVIPLTGIKIVTPLTRFMQGATVPAWFTGLPEPLSPLLLGSVNPPFKVQWINNCEDIIDIYGLFREIGIRYRSSDEISIHLKGIKSGRCNLGLNVTVPGVTAGSPKQKDILYSTAIELEVFEEIKLTSPFACTQNILVAPYSSLQLITNLEGRFTLTYSLQDEVFKEDKSVTVPNTVVTISETGLLQSYGIVGRAMVIVSASDDHGLKQSLTLVVIIKPIHYMMTNIATDWMIGGSPIPYIPLGVEMKFKMTYHDNTGATFTEALVDLRFRSNRFDLVESKRVSNGIISYTIKPGATLTKVWADGLQKTVDYVNIVSEKMLTPMLQTLNTGDVFCLHSPVVDKYWKYGLWHSDDIDVVKINPNTGIGQVVSETVAAGSVFYSLTSAVKIRFNIEPIKLITFKHDKLKVVSNDPPTRIPFLFSNLKNKSTKNNNFITGWACEDKLENAIKYFPFKCEIFFTNNNYDISEIFEAVPAFNGDLGLFSCNIIKTSDVTPNISIIESNITLIVILNNGIESEPVDLIYKPSVFISSDNLVLSDANLVTPLTITGLPEVLQQIKIIPMDANLLYVSEPIFIAPNTITFDIRLIDYHWKFAELQYPLSVTVISKMTHQNVQVMIKTSLGHDFNSRSLCMNQELGSPMGNFFYQNRHGFTIIFSMLILFFVTVYAYSHYIQPVINVNVASARSILAGANRTLTDTSPLMLHSTPTRLNRTYCAPTTCQGMNRSMTMNTTPITPLSGSPRFPDMSSAEMNRSLNTPDIRRNRRFL